MLYPLYITIYLYRNSMKHWYIIPLKIDYIYIYTHIFLYPIIYPKFPEIL